MIEAVIITWVICGVLSFGINYAEECAEFPDLATENPRGDMGWWALIALLGPFALVPSFFLSGFAQYGLRFTPPTKDTP